VIALFGGNGSIGSRYAAILRHMDVDYKVIEIDDDLPEFAQTTKCIIATPTDTHVDIINQIPDSIPILCEKPIDRNPNKIPKRKNCYMVNNYYHVMKIKGILPPYSVWYNYYKTGKDGLLWDCCQLVYLDEEARIETKSPRWNLSVNREWIKYRDLEESYVRMVSDFLNDKFHKLWSMEVAKEVTKAVIKRGSLDRHTS